MGVVVMGVVVMGVVVMGVVDMEEEEVVTMKVVAANLIILGIIQATALKVIRATKDIIVMKRENMGIMTKQVTVVITVNTGEKNRAITMEEAIMGNIIMGKKARKVQNTVKVEDIRKGTPPKDLTRYTKRTSTRKIMSSTMNTTTEVTTASMEVMGVTTARGAGVMKREDTTSQVIMMAITERRVITLRAITATTIRATKGRTDTTVTTATTPNMAARVVPLADPATVTVAEVAEEVVVVTEVAEAMEAAVTEVAEAMEVVVMEAVVMEVADMAATVVEDMEVVAMEAVVTEAVVNGDKYYKRGTRFLLLPLFNRVLHF